jgi:hypothetical protein
MNMMHALRPRAGSGGASKTANVFNEGKGVGMPMEE